MPHGAIPFPFGDCRICNDKATGIHYGVATCEGCKGFFKRSLSKADRYKCFFGGQCKLSPQNRNRCKSCRFQRCLATGMSVEAVKMGRIPKVDKERALEMHRNPDAVGVPGLDGGHPMGAGAAGWQGDMSAPHMPLQSPSAHLSHSSQQLHHHPPHSANDSPPSLQMGPVIKQENPMGQESCMGGAPAPSFYPQNTTASFHPRFPSAYPSSSTTSAITHQPQQPPHHYMSSQNHHRHHDHHHGHLPSGQPHVGDALNLSHAPPTQRDMSHMGQTEISPAHRHMAQRDMAQRDMAQREMAQREMAQRDMAQRDMAQAQVPRDMAQGHRDITQAHRDISKQQHHQQQQRDMQYLTPHMSEPSNVHIWNTNPHTSTMQHSGQGNVLQGTSRFDTSATDVKPVTIERPPHTHSGSDSGLSDMTSSDRSVMDVDGSSQSPQGLTSSAASVSGHRPSDSSDSTASIGKDVFSLPVIETLLSQVIQESNIEQTMNYEQPMESQPSEAGLNLSQDYKQGSSHGSTQSITQTHDTARSSAQSNVIDEPFSEDFMSNIKTTCFGDEFDDDLDLVFEDDLGESGPCDLSAQEPSSSTEKDQDLDLKLMVTKGSSIRCSSPSGDSEIIGSSVDEDNSYLLAKSYKTIERLYLEQFELQQNWIEKAYEVINGNLKKHPMNLVYDCSKEEAGKVWQNLFANIVPWNTRIIGFCSEIPGFTQLNKDDQGYFLKAGYYDLWMLAVLCAFIDDESYFFFDDGMYYSRWWMMHFLPLKFVLMMTRFWTELSLLNLKPVEIGLLMSIRLVNPDREEVKQPELAQVLQDHYINVLMHSLQQNHGPNSTQLWVKIMRILPSLDDVNRAQDEVIGNFQVDATPDVWEENLQALEAMGGDTKTFDFSSILNIRTASPKNVKLSNLLNKQT